MLIINRDIAIPASAIADVVIHFFHFSVFLLSEPDDKIKNQLYNMNIKVIKLKIHSVRFTAIWMRAMTYHNSFS
jgi:hypothetical protein